MTCQESLPIVRGQIHNNSRINDLRVGQSGAMDRECGTKVVHVAILQPRFAAGRAMIPGADGRYILSLIKSTDELTEVIVMTGRGSIEAAAECKELGAFGCLPKRSETAKLLKMLQRAYAARLSTLIHNYAHTRTPIHPAWLRCSSVIYPAIIRSSRLASRAARRSRYVTVTMNQGT
jgi:DNA-binding NtrC family response regulator